ncbi:hypothetical protein M8494_02505 [Serratia ureilytica]
MISTDSHLRITFMNPVAEQMCGWPLDLAIGMPVAGVVRLTNGKDGPEIEKPHAHPRQWPADYALAAQPRRALFRRAAVCLTAENPRR